MDLSALDLLPYQHAAVESPARFTWNCWARQTGKSFTFSLRRLVRALRRRRNQVILSAGERQSREVMEKVRMHCRAMRIWHELRELPFVDDASLRVLEARLPGRVRIIALPANARTSRGFTGDVFLDEFAMHADDEAIWAALLPTLLRGDGELDVASTPRGRKNVFFRLAGNALFERRTLTLEEAVASGLAADAAALRSAIDDDLTWRQEFCCEFADEATAFMTYELIRACEDVHLSTAVDWTRLADRRVEAYIGVDVGRRRDLTAIWIWERRAPSAATRGALPDAPRRDRAEDSGPPEVVFICRGLVTMERAAFADQEAVLAALLSAPAVRRCCIDAGGLGMQLAERLSTRFGGDRVEEVVFSPSVKSALAGRVRVLAERGALRIPPDEALARDWHALTRVVTAAGHIRFDADRSVDGHADRFWAAALGLHAAEHAVAGALDFATQGRLNFARHGVW